MFYETLMMYSFLMLAAWTAEKFVVEYKAQTARGRVLDCEECGTRALHTPESGCLKCLADVQAAEEEVVHWDYDHHLYTGEWKALDT